MLELELDYSEISQSKLYYEHPSLLVSSLNVLGVYQSSYASWTLVETSVPLFAPSEEC